MLSKKIYTIFFIPTFLPIFIFAKTIQNQKPEIIDLVETKQKVVALTFDADMTMKMQNHLKSGKVRSWYNIDVTNELEKENVPATLFLTGMWIETYPEITKQLSKNPLFELGNHTYSHKAFSPDCYGLTNIKKSEDVFEIQKTEDLLNKYATKHVMLFRFPGLCFNHFEVSRVKRLGYTSVGGNVVSGDAFQNSSQVIIDNVLSQVKPGSIIIMHLNGGPNAPETAIALKQIIPKLKSEGYTFVKISDLLKM